MDISKPMDFESTMDQTEHPEPMDLSEPMDFEPTIEKIIEMTDSRRKMHCQSQPKRIFFEQPAYEQGSKRQRRC